MLPPPTALPLSPPEQPPTIQAPSLDAEVPTGAVKNKEDVMRGPQLEDEDKGKGVQPPTKANSFEDALTIKDVVSQTKDAELKSKVKDSQSETADPKKDPLQAKA